MDPFSCTAGPPHPSTQKPPAFACIRCWKLKKKCNRSYPRCSRCPPGVDCFYSNQPPTRSALHFRENGSTVFSNTLIYEDRPTISYVLPTAVLPPPLSNFPQPEPVTYVPTSYARYHGFNSVFALFDEIRSEIQTICELYLQTTNTWLPIIVEEQLREQLARLGDKRDPNPELCILILCIYLVTHVSVQPTDEKRECDALYSVVKPFYAALQSTSPASISLIQAGMLLSVYEHGNVLGPQSYLSIGACARMGYSMGLHKTLHQDISATRQDRVTFQTSRHQWWCVIILERILALKNPKDKPPFATPDPSLEDFLPSPPCNKEADELSIPLGKPVATNLKAHDFTLSATNPFGRSAQASYLLSRVLEHTSKAPEDIDANRVEAEALDEKLQGFLLDVLDTSNHEPGKEWHHSCGAYSVGVNALLILHKHNISFADGGISQTPANFEFYNKSHAALRTISRTVMINNEGKANHVFLDPHFMPPFALQFFRDAALFSVQMIEDSCEEAEKETWTKNLQFLTHCLAALGRKWKLARYLLSDIQEAAASLKQFTV